MTIYLLDAHVYIFRAYYSLPAMAAPDGTPIHAAYGFANTLIRMIEAFRPTHFACVFDYAMTSFRNALEPEYKAGRTEAPEDLEPQFALCEDAARALGLGVFKARDFEADDVIASLCERWVGGSSRARIVTTDKDLAQLVRDDGSVVLLDFAKGRILDATGVRARFGVAPDQIPDYLALVGDAADNLPGVPGIGPKSAAALLRSFGDLAAFPRAPARWQETGVRGGRRLAANWSEHLERALRIRELATVRRDVPDLPDSPRVADYRGPDPERLRAFSERLRRPGLLRRGGRLMAAVAGN